MKFLPILIHIFIILIGGFFKSKLVVGPAIIRWLVLDIIISEL